MSHSGHMSMGSASLPDLQEFPHFYWAVVGSAIGVATLVNIYNHVLCRQRLSAARAGTVAPAKPKAGFTVAIATTFALVREASNFALHIPLKSRILRLPTVGRLSLVLANAITLIVLCFYGLELDGRPIEMEAVGHRCGALVISQVPLLFLLGGKNSIVGYLSGISYERLNWLHRWAARCMLLTATFHMGYFFRSWDAYKYIGTQLRTNEVAWKGLAAWCVLLWITFSSMTPIRGWNYELFVVQHLLSFTMFMTFVYLHIPIAYRGYFWTSVALFFLDRTLRAIRVLYANFSLFHPSKKAGNGKEGFWACKAEFTPLPHNTTRVVITNPPISWTPGQHVFLSCHSVAPLQSHPFTIASIPEDGKMEFLIKAEKGGTKRFFKHAEKSHGLGEVSTKIKTVAIEGPYGCLRPLRQFDSVVFLAGSTGATFTFPLLRDILQGWKENGIPGSNTTNSFRFTRLDGAVTRHVRFVWVVKSKGQLGWLSEQLSTIYQDFESLQDTLRDIKLEITVYVTCDETFTEEHSSLLSSIAAPNREADPKPNVAHGVVQYRGPQRGAGEAGDVEMSEMKTKPRIESEVKESPPTCTCRTPIDDSTSPDTSSQPCCCSPQAKNIPSKHNRLSSESSTSPLLLKQKLFVHPAITVYAGRPKPRDIIRRSLEQALGEAAVVVCGPQGLVADVKQDVCALSDERAVHKGTGAQGIYLHTESFGY